MKEQINAWRLEEIAENARQIVEEENTDAHDNFTTQSRIQQLQKLRKKPIITGKKNLEKAKIRGFRKEIEKFFI